MPKNHWNYAVKRNPLQVVTRRLLLYLLLLGLLGFFVNTLISFLTTTLDVCLPKTNIVFLKTHKCASSSIQNILMRYGDSHQLNFVLPKTNNYLGHPAVFSRTMVMKPLLPFYNVLSHHTRFDYNAIQDLMPRNSIYITILRDPVEVFESAFSYYGLSSYWNSNLYSFIAQIRNQSKEMLHRRVRGKFGSNQMMFDLGADPAIFTNDSLVEQYIDKLESWFDLVLISDRMDESLVLLRHLMCWNIDDVITFKLNSRDPKFKSSLSEKEKNVLRNLNHADVLLYKRFLERFEKAIDAFGRNRMAEETRQLQERRQKWYDICVRGEQRHGTSKKNPKYYINPKVMVLKTNEDVSNATCLSLTTEELKYTDVLRKRQLSRVFVRSSALPPHTVHIV